MNALFCAKIIRRINYLQHSEMRLI